MTMLWYKSWRDTRWRFLVGFALLVCEAAIAVFGYPRVTRLLVVQPAIDTSTIVGRKLADIVTLSQTFGGYVWAQWLRQEALQMTTLFAVLLGSGGVLSQGGGGDLYTLSLPASRRHILFVRAALGFSELLLIAAVPCLLITVAAPAIGERFGLANAVVYATCLFIAGGVFFSLALLLSTSYGDVWRPLLIALAAALVLGLVEQVPSAAAPFGIFRLMTAETYFRSARVPWIELAAAATLSAALIYAAAANIDRRDY
jgi:hypothetical protein